MATLANFVNVPCLVNTSTIPVNVVNAGATPRTPTPLPLNISTGGSTDPVGPQRWPTKL